MGYCELSRQKQFINAKFVRRGHCNANFSQFILWKNMLNVRLVKVWQILASIITPLTQKNLAFFPLLCAIMINVTLVHIPNFHFTNMYQKHFQSGSKEWNDSKTDLEGAQKWLKNWLKTRSETRSKLTQNRLKNGWTLAENWLKIVLKLPQNWHKVGWNLPKNWHKIGLNTVIAITNRMALKKMSRKFPKMF